MSTYRIVTARESGRIAPLKFEHAGLRTTRLKPMVEWYANVLQADIAYQNEMLAFLWYDEQNHRLVIIARPGTVERLPNSAGLDHLAFTYADLRELVSTYQRLKSFGIAPQRVTDHGSSISFYYLDPDSNQVELKVDTFATPEEQHAYLRSETFTKNPLGNSVDPEALAVQVLGTPSVEC